MLIAALLLVPVGNYAHEIEHQFGQQDDHCIACLIAPKVGAGALPSVPPLADQRYHPIPQSLVHTLSTTRRDTARHPRDPPSPAA